MNERGKWRGKREIKTTKKNIALNSLRIRERLTP